MTSGAQNDYHKPGNSYIQVFSWECPQKKKRGSIKPKSAATCNVDKFAKVAVSQKTTTDLSIQRACYEICWHSWVDYPLSM